MIDKARVLWTKLPGRRRRALRMAMGALLGGVLGYAYYATVGCSGGGCAITSDPLVSSAWGAVMGGLLTS